MSKPAVAIIGAGISGLLLARELSDVADVTVYEKARGVGGRMATRYADPYYFDHGAQCFTARTKPFQKFLSPLLENGSVEEWTGKVINIESGKKITKRLWFEKHLVPAPNMNSLCKILSENLTIRLQTEVAPFSRKQDDGWHLKDKNNALLGVYDWVISTAPPAQTLALFSGQVAKDEALANAKLYGCYALMLGFNRPWDREWIAAKVHNNPIKWISVNSTKPGRNKDVTCFVAHSRNNWAEEHINDDMDSAQQTLLSEFSSVTGIDAAKADFIHTHRWRYAIVEDTQQSGPFMDEKLGLAATSDWAMTSRIEEVWISCMDLVRMLKPVLLNSRLS